MIGGALPKSYYYWRATSSRYDWEDERYMFCTTSQAFTIAGDTECEARGYRTEAFNEIALGEATDYTLTLTARSQGMPGPDAPIGDSAAADVPGTHGEPYTISGILSHCDVYDASMACEIHAEGWRYVASSAGPTPLSLLEDLNMLPLNTPVQISGDMIGHDGFTVDVTIREATPGGRDMFHTVRENLQGLWESGGSQVLIHGGMWEDQLLGTTIFSHPMFIDAECATMPSASPAISFRSAETGEFDSCLIILELDETRLRVAYAGTSSETLYRRVD